jgi:hypothetical protein
MVKSGGGGSRSRVFSIFLLSNGGFWIQWDFSGFRVGSYGSNGFVLISPS